MTKKIELTQEQVNEICELYKSNLSVIETAKKVNLGKNKTRKILKEQGILLTISDYAKLRTGESNPFYGKKHSEENRNKHSEYMKTRLGKLNPNYRHGNYKRRPRDFKIAEFRPIRNFVFNRDKHTCQLTGAKGGHLHAHHLIPHWVCEAAYFDPENLITVSTEAHLKLCHNNNWWSFNVSLIPDKLLEKYNLDRERLNELANLYNKLD